MTAIAFDIEVAGFPWDEVDEITRGYLLNRERDPSRRDAVPEPPAPLDPGEPGLVGKHTKVSCAHCQ